MAYNEALAGRIRDALSRTRRVEEKRMFRGVTFMVNGKMCVSVGHDDMMCRIDPSLHDTVVHRNGCRPVVMKGREYKGWILITEEGWKAKKDFDFWISLSLAFNKHAKASKKKKG